MRACIHFHNSCALLDMNEIYLEGRGGGCTGGFVLTLCSFAKEKRKNTHTNRQTKKKQTGHKKAQTATLEGAGEARDGGRGGRGGEGWGLQREGEE